MKNTDEIVSEITRLIDRRGYLIKQRERIEVTLSFSNGEVIKEGQCVAGCAGKVFSHTFDIAPQFLTEMALNQDQLLRIELKEIDKKLQSFK